MSIRAMDPSSWLSYVLTGHKHDAIAARNQGMLELNYEPDIQIYRFNTNYRVNYTMVSDPNYDALVTQSLTASTTDQYKAVMQKVNQLVAQQHYVISVCQPQLFTVYQPWLKGFSAQNESLSATGSNSALWFFQFGARFWIDSKLKTSLGH
jgi:ABC-type transport system substrate-binding protein